MTNDLNGTWELNVKVGGKSGVATFQLTEAQDNTLIGTYTGHLGSAQVSGVINSDDFEFWFDWHHGKVKYKGECADGEMSGTCIYGTVGEGEFVGSKVAD